MSQRLTQGTAITDPNQNRWQQCEERGTDRGTAEPPTVPRQRWTTDSVSEFKRLDPADPRRTGTPQAKSDVSVSPQAPEEETAMVK